MLRKLVCLAGFIAATTCPFSGQSAAHRIGQIVQKVPNTTNAQIVPYARVSICSDAAGCTGVEVYQDAGLTTPFIQPLTADSNGIYTYYVSPGCYKEQILTPGTPVRDVSGVCLSAPNGAGSGTVTSVSLTAANGFTGGVNNPSTVPSIVINVDSTHYLPTTNDVTNWNSKQTALGFTPENTANKNQVNGYAGLNGSGILSTAVLPAFSGDASSAAGSSVLTLASVNSSSGVCGDATHVCQITTNSKGLTTNQTAIALNGLTSLSVGGLSPLFTTNVANPTTTPSVAFTLVAVNQNSVFAGPPSGGPGVPTFQTAPTFSAANLTNFPAFSASTPGVVSASGGGTTNFLRADGTWAAPPGGGGGMVYPTAGIANSTGTAWGTSYSASNLIPANFLPVATTGAFGTVKPDGTTITISGGVISSVGGSGITGLTTGYLPQATSSTAIGNSFIDYGVTTAGTYTSTKPISAPSFTSTDTSGVGLGFMGIEGTAPTGVSGSDGCWADSTRHRWMCNNNNTGALIVVGQATAGTAGNPVVLDTNGIDIVQVTDGITASGTSCAITAITKGRITGATCTP